MNHPHAGPPPLMHSPPKKAFPVVGVGLGMTLVETSQDYQAYDAHYEF